MNKCETCKHHTADDGWMACDCCIHDSGLKDRFEPVTNADKLRAMPDGKLAKCLALTIAYCTSVLCDDKYVPSDEDVCKITDILLRMLQSPAKSEVE